MANGKRNTALLFIGAGLYLAIGHLAGFVAAGALVLALLGFAIVRFSLDSERKDMAGYVLLVVSGIVLLGSHWLFALLVASAVIWFVRKAKQSGEPLPRPDIPFDRSFVKQHIVASVRWGGSEPWTVRSSELAVAIVEVRIDMTNAIFEEPTVDLRLTGLIGDIDVIVPDDVGLAVHADVAIGEIKVAGERGAGIMNRLVWRSTNFETAEHRVQLYVSYAVADVDVKVL